MKKALILLAIALTGCTDRPYAPYLPRPTTVIEGSSIQAVASKISELCNRKGGSVTARDNLGVVCSGKSSPSAQQITADTTQSLIKTKFFIYPLNGKKVKVAPRAWIESGTSSQKIDYDTEEARQSMQSLLDAAKTELERKP